MIIENLIIGGGISGLLAARKLADPGKKYLLLEAKSVLGGRIYSPHTEDNSHQHDLGPTWIFPHQIKMQSLLAQLSIHSFEQQATGDLVYQQSINNITRHAGTQGASMYRVEGGILSVIDALAMPLDKSAIKTGYCVNNIQRHVNHQDSAWQVSARHKGEEVEITATNLILALAPRMIIEHLKPAQWASTALINALQNTSTWMAAQAKCLVVYEQPFWRAQGLSGQAFSAIGPMQEIHDASANEQAPYALFGFIGINALQRASLSTQQLQQACINQLVNIFGEQAATYQQVYLKDWAVDKFTASAQDLKETPQHPNFAINLFKDELETKRVHLVASEFSAIDPGYLEGAVEAVDSNLVVTNLSILKAGK
jgi:monoamine oxidase